MLLRSLNTSTVVRSHFPRQTVEWTIHALQLANLALREP